MMADSRLLSLAEVVGGFGGRVIRWSYGRLDWAGGGSVRAQSQLVGRADVVDRTGVPSACRRRGTGCVALGDRQPSALHMAQAVAVGGDGELYPL